jgi:hypothetical protein
MPPILSCCPRLEVEAGGMTVEVEPSCLKCVSSVAVRQMAAEEQSRKLASHMEVCMKRSVSLNSFMQKEMHPLTFRPHSGQSWNFVLSCM